MEESSNKTKKIVYIVLSLMVIVLVCLVMFVVVPMTKKVYEVKDGFEEKKLLFEMIKKDASDSKKFSDLVADLGQDQELVEKAVINEDSIVEFIKEIEVVSSEVGNEIEITHKKNIAKRSAPSVLNPDPEAEKQRKEAELKEKNTVRLEVVVSGNYKQFLEFFYKLENMTYIFNVESFKINGSKSKKGLLPNEEVSPEWTEGTVTIAFVPKKVSVESEQEQ